MNEEIMNPATTGMTVNESMKTDLLSAAKWAKFLCIVGCIGMAFVVIFALVMLFAGSLMARVYPGAPLGAAMGFLYLIIAAIYIYPLIKGFQFANGTKAACLSNNESELARGFEGLRSLLQYCGVLAIICLLLYALVFIGFIFAVIVGLNA